MIFKRKFTVLCSLFLITYNINAQYTNEWGAGMMSELRLEIYKTIVLSEELLSDRKCHIVTIPSTSLNMNYHSGFVNFISDIEVKQDTTSKEFLSKELPSNYWVYYVEDPIESMNVGEEYLNYFHKVDTLKMSAKDEFCLCQNLYDIIKIYEPFDKWFNVYKSVFSMNYIYEVTIPVKYESLDKYKKLIKEEYYLFKISNNIIDGKFQMVKNVVKLE